MTSLTPDITEKIPALLSARAVSSRGSSSSVLYDVVISGIGFVLATSTNSPYQRQSEATQKEQIDTSTEAGEQTLGGPWVRSQTSWHLGAGIKVYEPGARDRLAPSQYRYDTSVGVDVWGEGDLRLLKKMDQVASSSNIWRVAAVNDGSAGYIATDGTRVYRYNTSGGLVWTSAAFLGGMGGFNHSPVVAGTKVIVADAAGIWSLSVNDGTGHVLLWTTAGAYTPAAPFWVKSRLVAFYDNDVYELSLAGGDLNAATPVYAPPAPMQWLAATEVPDAILIAGRETGSGRSAIYSFTLETDSGGAVPKLGQPFQVAELPTGENLNDMGTYLGAYVILCTSLGVRVGTVGQSGQIRYGPVIASGVGMKVAFSDRFAYTYMATKDGADLVPWTARIDLGAPIDDTGAFAWAPDAVIPTTQLGSGSSIAVIAGQVAVANGYGVLLQSLTEYEPEGWITSGQIRYGTTEPKAFRTLDLEAATPGDTSVAASVVVDDVVLTLATLAQNKSGHGISLASVPSPTTQVGYRLTLKGGTETPIVRAVAVKAVPLPTRQRLVLYPVQLADDGRDAKNTPYGKTGYASTVLEALEALENSQTIVTVNDLTRPEQYEATIEQIRFTRVRGRAKGGAGNFGGTAEITLRTL